MSELEKLVQQRAELDAKIHAEKRRLAEEFRCPSVLDKDCKVVSGAAHTAPPEVHEAVMGAKEWVGTEDIRCIAPKGHKNDHRSKRHDDGSYLVW